MNRITRYSALTILLVSISCDGALAQVHRTQVDPTALPRGDQFYKHRLKLQYVNENPEWTDATHAPEAPKRLVVEVAPKGQPQEEVYVIRPGQGGGGQPGMILAPQPAGFRSHMAEAALPRNNSLPSGRSTNLLNRADKAVSGRMAPPSQAMTAAPQRAQAAPKRTQAEPQALQYNRPPASVSGDSGYQTKTTLTGKMTGRGSLLSTTPK